MSSCHIVKITYNQNNFFVSLVISYKENSVADLWEREIRNQTTLLVKNYRTTNGNFQEV